MTRLRSGATLPPMVGRGSARSGPARRGVMLVLLVAWGVSLVAAGCGVRGLRRSEVAPGAIAQAPQKEATLKAHLRDGSVVVFDRWTFVESERAVHGSGRLLDPDRRAEPAREHVLTVDSVALFESDQLHVPGAMAPMTIMMGLHGAATLLCVTHPKACFGSCPTFHAWDGERQVLVAEAFSASVAPSLESTDLDALDRVRAAGDRLEMLVTNDAMETHVIRRADLVVVERPPGARVVADPERALWLVSAPSAPDAATGGEGDCRAALAARDGHERTSLADSTDLAARETITLRFDAPPAGDLGIVLVARQSLLSTFVFYQTLAWMGRSAGHWLATLERDDAAKRGPAFGPARALGGIEVQVREGGDWRTAGTYQETGPLASDTRLLRLPHLAAGPLEVRLRLTQGLWRLDQASLVTVTAPATPVRLAPESVTRQGRPDAVALASLRGGAAPLVTLPGDSLVVRWALPAATGANERELFLESRGYYLEWMRDAWLAEEDPVRLAGLFLDPHAALRRLAPEFKRVEPEMESVFWGSRYAR